MTTPFTDWAAVGRTSATLEVHLLGLVDFDAALALQERLVFELSGREDTQGALLLCEHPPLITIGREGSRAHVHAESRELERKQIDVRWLNRGGGCMVHSPGQLAAYPIVPLARLGIGLLDYRHRLEDAVIATAQELKVPAWSREDAPGVWGRCGQFAFVGAAVKSWVSHQGLFVNVAPTTEFLRMVQWNAADERVTSLAAQRSRPTSMHSVREALVRHLAAGLGYLRYHVYTGHPLLRRTLRKVYVSA